MAAPAAMILIAVLPTYNEIGNLQRVADALLGLELPGTELRLLVVDDASPDGTGALADRIAANAPGRVAVVHRAAKSGLGSAYIDGFTRAIATGAELIAQMDADLSHEPGALPAMLEVAASADLVIGSRYIPGGGVDRNWSPRRKLTSWMANRVVVPALLGLPATDATSGYRLWRREALARILRTRQVRSSGYGFQVEMVFLAQRLGLRIGEVPIYFRERELGESKMTLQVALTTLRDILAMRRRQD